MAINAVIQGGAGSTRLPTKVLADLGGRPVLEWVVRAEQGAAQISTVIVAALRMPGDDVVVDFAQSLRATVVARTTCFPASCRHWMPAPQTLSYRLTADCPLLDPTLIDAVAGAWAAAPSHDYVSTVLVRCLPRGLDVKLVTASALRAVDRIAVGHDRVHVTSLLYSQPKPLPPAWVCVSRPSRTTYG
jgi:spore coat polysaccharide biosynthesis protein SpsF